jgi:hypothetical protein
MKRGPLCLSQVLGVLLLGGCNAILGISHHDFAADTPDGGGPEGGVPCRPGAEAACDLVAQAGCAADMKCTIDKCGNPICAPLPVPATDLRSGGEACSTATSGGIATDDCAPGSWCYSDCTRKCRLLCQSDHDCPGSTICAVTVGGVARACTDTGLSCNVVPDDSTCMIRGQDCYLSMKNPDQSYCDCPSKNAGGPGAACEVQTDCQPGNVCIDPLGGSSRSCHPGCGFGNITTTCDPGGGTCFPVPGSSLASGIQWGYCN